MKPLPFSSSSKKFDVFLSFRGADTRDNIVSHLYKALRRQGIITFKDDIELDRGKRISEILKAIEGSSVSVIIFSKNFAFSSFCLDEVVKIIRCRKTHRQEVLPVFYGVDPSDVESQTGSFKNAFDEYEEFYKNDVNKVGRWRIALSKAANITGWDSKILRPDSTLVQEVVDNILKKLRNIYTDDFEQLVELRSQKRLVDTLINTQNEGVQFVGIWGMGGAGKTSVSRLIFKKISCRFRASCFLENVKKSIKRGREHLRHEMLSQIFGERNKFGGTYDWRLNNLRCIEALIVIDDIDDCEQLEILAGGRDWFGDGSVIIVTSRDRHVFEGKVDQIYEVETLNNVEALRLFSHFAFGRNQNPKKEYMELSDRVVSYSKGNPLVLKVLGSFLYSRGVEEWESALNKYVITRLPDKKIQNAFKLSYDGLDREVQAIFHHISCGLRGEQVSCVLNVLDGCGFSTLIGLRVLAERALIIMSKFNYVGKVEMHDLLQDFGRELVRQECLQNPGKRSMLWHHADISDVFINNSGTERIQSIVLDQTKASGLCLAATAFGNMTQLKVLKFHDDSCKLDEHFPSFEEAKVKVDAQGLVCLPQELRYIRWDMCPLKSLPSNFVGEQLVLLDFSGSQFRTLWTGMQKLGNMKEIKLRHCKQLIEMPDLSGSPNLKELDCTGCTSLAEIPSSIEKLNNLGYLDLKFCTQITGLPSTTSLTSLTVLSLYGCTNIRQFPACSTNIETLDLGRTSIEEIPSSSIQNLSQLRELDLSDCRLRKLPGELFELESLDHLLLGGPYIKSETGSLSSLYTLDLSNSNFESIPPEITQLNCLRGLTIDFCRNLRFLPELPKCVRLRAMCCSSLESIDGIASEDEDYLVQHEAGTLWLVNCFKLNENERRKILIQVWERLLFLARKISTLCTETIPIGLAKFYSFIPGIETPKWMKYRSMGSSITIQLPQDWHLKYFLGVVLCSVISFKQDGEYDNLNIKWECEFKRNDGETCYFPTSYSTWSRSYCPIEGEHIFLMYDTDLPANVIRQLHSQYRYDEISFQVHLENYPDNRSLPFVRVIACGVQPLFYHSTEFQSISNHTDEKTIRNFIGDDDEDDQEDTNDADSTGTCAGSEAEEVDPKAEATDKQYEKDKSDNKNSETQGQATVPKKLEGFDEASIIECNKKLDEMRTLPTEDPLYSAACGIFCEGKDYREQWLILAQKPEQVRINWIGMVAKRLGLL